MEHIELAKSDIEKVRGVDGFPNGSYESIRSLSNAPSYVTCPPILVPVSELVEI